MLRNDMMYSRNLSAPAFAADFLPEAPKFNQRTFHVRLINLCTSDKKLSHKIRHREIPRVHYVKREEQRYGCFVRLAGPPPERVRKTL